ncbi:MAG: TetR/AcrR family transcriptional regulator [Myxococcota bacterium]
MTAPAAAAPRDVSTRERLLDVALEAFSELGYDGASTRTIATRAGVNQGMIPYYFGTKEALWREAVDRAFAELRGEIDPVIDADVPNDRERLARMIRALVRYVARRPAFARLMSEEGKREGPRMHWIVDRHIRPLFDVTEHMGGLVDTTPYGGRFVPLYFYILVGAVTLIFHQAPECRRLTGLDPTDDAMVEAHADALIALFVPKPEGGTG